MEKEKKFKKILSSPIMYMFLTIVFSVILSHIETSHAISNYLYNSSDVSFDNTVSGIVSNDVQDAIDELYFHATDYSEIKNKIGNNALTTNNQTLTGGINELKTTMGSGKLNTTSQNLIGGVNELNGHIAMQDISSIFSLDISSSNNSATLNTVKFYKIGNVVYFDISLKNVTFASTRNLWTTFGKITSYIPSQNWFLSANYADDNFLGALIDKSGEIKLMTNTNFTNKYVGIWGHYIL